MSSTDAQVIVLTGGGGVLCSAIAKGLASTNSKLVLLDLDLGKAEAALRDVKAAGGDGLALKASVLDRTSLKDAADRIMSSYGRVDVLINGAGGNHPGATTSTEQSFFDLPDDGTRFVFDLNFLGTLLPSQVFGRIMAMQKRGSILNIASMNAFRPLTRIPAYSAAKAAIANFTQWLAVHMSQNVSTEIRVNAVAPGFFLTEQNRFLLTQEGGGLTERGERIIDHTPMGRFGDPEDLIGAVRWLISPDAKFVHGVILPIDGGFSAYSGV